MVPSVVGSVGGLSAGRVLQLPLKVPLKVLKVFQRKVQETISREEKEEEAARAAIAARAAKATGAATRLEQTAVLRAVRVGRTGRCGSAVAIVWRTLLWTTRKTPYWPWP
jgi:hypothetical protein